MLRRGKRFSGAPPKALILLIWAPGVACMNEMAVTLLGASGTTLSVVSLIPQVLKTWRTRHADDISAGWLILALVSMVVWVAYGSLAGAPAIAWANGLTFVQI